MNGRGGGAADGAPAGNAALRVEDKIYFLIEQRVKRMKFIQGEGAQVLSKGAGQLDCPPGHVVRLPEGQAFIDQVIGQLHLPPSQFAVPHADPLPGTRAKPAKAEPAKPVELPDAASALSPAAVRASRAVA